MSGNHLSGLTGHFPGEDDHLNSRQDSKKTGKQIQTLGYFGAPQAAVDGARFVNDPGYAIPQQHIRPRDARFVEKAREIALRAAGIVTRNEAEGRASLTSHCPRRLQQYQQPGTRAAIEWVEMGHRPARCDSFAPLLQGCNVRFAQSARALFHICDHSSFFRIGTIGTICWTDHRPSTIFALFGSCIPHELNWRHHDGQPA
jgi:hypothetical protein